MKWGSVNFDALKKLRDNVASMEKGSSAFYETLAKEMAARLLALATDRTPVYEGPDHPGGTLKRGWTVSRIEKRGGSYQVTVTNPIEYASYVEYGHRTRKDRTWGSGARQPPRSEAEINALMKKRAVGWHPGKYMLTLSERDLRSWIEAGNLEKRLQAYLEKAFDGL